MNCPFCKYPVEDGASFCSACGMDFQDMTSHPDETSPPDDASPVSASESPPGAGAASAAGTSHLPPDMDLPPLDDGELSLPDLEIPPLSGTCAPPCSDKDEAMRHGGNGAGAEKEDSPLESDPFSLELDTMLSLQERVGNSLRFLFSPTVRGKNFTEVTLSLSSEDIQAKSKKRNFVSSSEPYEFVFGVRGLEPGVYVCDILLSYVLDGRRFSYEGPLELVVQNRRDHHEEAVRSLALLCSQEVDSLARDSSYLRVKIPEYAKNVLKTEMERGRDPLEMVEGLVNLGARQYRKIRMFKRDMVEVLQTPPPEASCKEIQLDFGYGFGKVQFFTDPIIGIGHTSEGVRYTDIVIDPPEGLDAVRRLPYEKMSRGHCVIRSNGVEVAIADGRIRASGVSSPSTNGTYLDGNKIGTGDYGVRLPQKASIWLGTSSRETTLDATLVTPKAEACQRCRLGGDGREYCCRCGSAATNVVLKRRDGVAVVYVALWSCIDIGCIHSAFSGLEIFYDGHAFAWRRGTKRGWLVPGDKVELSHFTSIIVSPVWNDSSGHHLNNQGITRKGGSE